MSDNGLIGFHGMTASAFFNVMLSSLQKFLLQMLPIAHRDIIVPVGVATSRLEEISALSVYSLVPRLNSVLLKACPALYH